MSDATEPQRVRIAIEAERMKLAKAIEALVREFETETGLEVAEVRINRISNSQSSVPIAYAAPVIRLTGPWPS